MKVQDSLAESRHREDLRHRQGDELQSNGEPGRRESTGNRERGEPEVAPRGVKCRIAGRAGIGGGARRGPAGGGAGLSERIEETLLGRNLSERGVSTPR